MATEELPTTTLVAWVEAADAVADAAAVSLLLSGLPDGIEWPLGRPTVMSEVDETGTRVVGAVLVLHDGRRADVPVDLDTQELTCASAFLEALADWNVEHDLEIIVEYANEEIASIVNGDLSDLRRGLLDPWREHLGQPEA